MIKGKLFKPIFAIKNKNVLEFSKAGVDCFN